jgi:adenylate cyclase
VVDDARRLAAIMFTDVAGFTSLAQADEAGALRLLQEQAEVVRAVLANHRGREVKSMGDGLLLEFPSALDAIECAVALQRGLHERHGPPGIAPFEVRIGIHLGDVQGRGADILGDAVNIASRVESLAEPGGICLSAQVFDQIHSKVPYRLEGLGPQMVKGIRSPIEVYRVALPWRQGGESPPGSTIPRLAVLPLANISPDSKDEYFADGLTEELISVLSRLRGLRVIARTSVSPYKSAPKPVRQIAAELGVSSVLEGSVRKAGNRLRITLQLIDATTEVHRWAQSYDRELDDVFAIQAEVAEKTARALSLEILGPDRSAIQKKPTANLEAFELYLRGISAFHRTADEGWTRAGAEGAARFFELAIAKDPAFSMAHSYCANLLIGVMGEAFPRAEVVPRIREHVKKALELDPESADAHTARGNFALQVEFDWRRAEEEFRAAIALNPSSMPAHGWYGILLMVLRRFGEAQREFAAAIELDPLFLRLTYWQIGAHHLAGDTDSAIAIATRALERDAGNRILHLSLADMYLARGQPDEARREVAFAAGPLNDSRSVIERMCLLARLGEPDEGRRFITAWEAGRETRYVRPSLVASLLATLGEKEKALILLERDSREGERDLYIDYQRSSFDSIRNDARFLALLDRMNLTIGRTRNDGVAEDVARPRG